LNAAILGGDGPDPPRFSIGGNAPTEHAFFQRDEQIVRRDAEEVTA